MNASLVVNPAAGRNSFASLNRIQSLLQKKSSLSTYITDKKGDAFDFAHTLKETDRLVVAGGDGTINEVINGLLSSPDQETRDIPVSIIPVGTVNVLAKELGIPEDINGAVQRIFSGSVKKISLGRINGRYFSLMAGIGFDADTVLGVKHDFIKKISGRLAHVVSGVKVLTRYHPSLIKIITHEKEMEGYTAIIGNARCYAGNHYVTLRASVSEHLLDICVFKGRTRLDMLRFVSGVLRQKHLEFNDVEYAKTSELEVTSENEVHVQIDGEYFGTLPVKINVVKNAVNLVW
ncbi:MAG: diacylglycerol kinase family lipid kinase [Nitrospiraceae bacterium]|nr:MAG: diacylglycerol kinase family lipid kinase [Nitrospiraceae bacterium]